ncbi:MAG: hypothetical protein KGI50_03060 [Patescibacteria group bacterium]|nr:hypothetical protein [Patescibacteria group bacterium]MDE2438272.1 hypothetical protein [Patescibacteria group bacterium]
MSDNQRTQYLMEEHYTPAHHKNNPEKSEASTNPFELGPDPEGELKAFIRYLAMAKEGVSYFICTPEDREKTVEQIKKELEHIRGINEINITIPPDTDFNAFQPLQLYFEIEELKQKGAIQNNNIIFIYGIENVQKDLRTFVGLNHSRNSIIPRNGPIVFWLPSPNLLRIFSQNAPDFFSARSGVYIYSSED